MDLEQIWTSYDYVAFDTETSGAYPVGHDIVEFGAVKWRNGQEIGRLQFLLKPREPMTDFIIGIHGITNEMVEGRPAAREVAREIGDFFKNAVLLAHHAPFDMGFVAVMFEEAQLPLPQEPVLCTSLLARKLITGTENHKLQTLVKHLGLDGGSAHRAFDDARSCLGVGLECLRLLGENATLKHALTHQGKNLHWPLYEVLRSTNPTIATIRQAVLQKSDVEMIYDKAKETRRITPLGIVRSPDGDFVQAVCRRDGTAKRFYLEKIKDAQALMPGI